MPNVVVIVQDERVRRQTEQYLQELDMDDLRFATFRTQAEFAALYWRDRKKVAEAANEEPKAEGAGEEEGADLKLFSEVHLVIFSLDTIGEKPTTWLEKLKAKFKTFGYWPEKTPLRSILLKYEEDGISKLDVMHPILDDLIYLPLDRLIFLQKVQIILGLPKVIKPSFLFNQEVNLQVEISKIAKMDRLSDVGLAIRNPLPLKKGLPGHFYIQLPGEKARLEVRAKVFRSEPHPDFPGQYLVYFSYFGLNKNDLSRIRQNLSKAPRYQSLYSDDRALFRFQSDDLFITAEESRVFGLAIIDTDEQMAASVAQQITKDMDRVSVGTETSYQMFLHRYFENANAEAQPMRPTDPSDLFAEAINLRVVPESCRILTITPPAPPAAMLLQHSAAELYANPEKILNMLADKAARSVFEESVQLAAGGRRVDRLLAVNDASGARRGLKFAFRPIGAEVQVEMRAASLNDIVETTANESRQKELEMLIMDSNFMPEDPAPTILGLRTRAVDVGLVKEPEQLKFMVLAETDDRASGSLLNTPDVLALLLKPVDPRQLLFLISEFLPNKNTIYQFDNLGWSQPALPIHVSKAIQLEALSEFGATLKARQRIIPGTMVYLRKSIYENAPNNCLAARVYACEPHPSEKDHFNIYTTYFGINDQFLKFARTWIRENYAQQKGGKE